MPDQMSHNLYEIFADIAQNIRAKKPITPDMFYEFLATSSSQDIHIGDRVKDDILCPTAKLIIEHLPKESRFEAYIATHANMNDPVERRHALTKALGSVTSIADKAEHYDAAMKVFYRATESDGLKAPALDVAAESTQYLPKERQELAGNLVQDHKDFMSIGSGTPEHDFETIITLLKRTGSQGIRSECERLAYKIIDQIPGKDQKIEAAQQLLVLTESAATKQNLKLFYLDPSPAANLVERYKSILEEYKPETPESPSL